MFGIILISLGSFFEEISTVIGKKEVQARKESINTMAFLTLFGSLVWFLVLVAVHGNFIFSIASLPMVVAKILLEIILTYISLTAIIKSDRSTFSFIRTGTVPLLLLVDIVLGYTISSKQILGMILIISSLIVLFIHHGIKKKGISYAIAATIIPVITISIYKYNITHYNSVEAESIITIAALVIYFYLSALIVRKENPFKLLIKPVFFIESLTEGIGCIFTSFAFLFAPASIMTTGRRSTSVLWSLLSGNVYFHEKHFLLKLITSLALIGGIVLLI